MSMPQTPTHVSILQKLFGYFQLAAALGMAIPEKHVQAISMVIETIMADLTAGPEPLVPPAPVTQINVPVIATPASLPPPTIGLVGGTVPNAPNPPVTG